jgi:hypothetical protein
MQIHLLHCKSSNALVGQFAAQKLHICMLALSELRDTYWGADFVFEMFQRAQKKLLETCVNPLPDNAPEVAPLQTEAAAGIMQTTMLPPSNAGGASDDTSNSFGVSNTVPSRLVSPV